MVAGLAWQVVSVTLSVVLWADFALRIRKTKVSGNFNNAHIDGFEVLRDSRKFEIFQVCK